jgi:hypothetical protein
VSKADAESSAEDKAYKAYLWKFCLGQEGFVQGELDHIREVVSKYEIDALWIDGDGPSTCYCDECVRQLREEGLDPLNSDVQDEHKLGLNYSFLKRIHDLVKDVRPNCRVCPQNQSSFGLAKRAPLVDYTDHEALFTDAQHFGYSYFGAMIRYARGFGVPIYGPTVCFKDFWADFYEDPVPLRDVTVRLNVPLRNVKARALYAGEQIPLRRAADNGAEVLVPRVNIHEVICFENSEA